MNACDHDSDLAASHAIDGTWGCYVCATVIPYPRVYCDIHEERWS